VFLFGPVLIPVEEVPQCDKKKDAGEKGDQPEKIEKFWFENAPYLFRQILAIPCKVAVMTPQPHQSFVGEKGNPENLEIAGDTIGHMKVVAAGRADFGEDLIAGPNSAFGTENKEHFHSP
jgi:hypothetical protein